MTPARDAILVRGVEFEASHGYTAAERKLTRRFRCDVELTLDLDASARTDQIRDTVDYRVVCAVIVEIGTQRTFKLLEGLAGAIVAALQDAHPHAGITLTLEKLAPPCPGTPESTAVRLSRPAAR